MRIIFFGTPEFAVPSLNSLIESGNNIIAAVTQPDRVKGRGRKLAQPPVKEIALSRGVPVLQPSGIDSGTIREELADLKPDIIAVVAYGKIIPLSLLDLPPLGCINVHASLLPKYRGAAPIQWALINGDNLTGITTMLMDEGLDTGDMLLQDKMEITDEDTSFSLSRRLSEMGSSLLLRTIEGLQKGSIRSRPQTGEASYAPSLKKEDGRIDWSSPARKIFDLIRGTYPWPGAYCYLNSERITLIKAKPLTSGLGGIPGRIKTVSDEGLFVETGEDILFIHELKPEGKNNMSAAAFIHGRHLKEGMHFETP
jgi:methionyl-tRNA formyltransferase